MNKELKNICYTTDVPNYAFDLDITRRNKGGDILPKIVQPKEYYEDQLLKS